MGILRVIFALAVVFDHSWTSGSVFVGGKNAVQLFYMISGFLISYILLEAKSYSRIRDFYLGRFLRIYPVYATVAIASLICVFWLKEPEFLSVYRNAPINAVAFLGLVNVTVFGQDWVLFSGIDSGKFTFSSDFRKSDVQLYQGLLVPQAWTLGVELTFYALAPFLFARRWLFWTFMASSVATRAALLYLGFAGSDPWRYRFFPAELSLFLLGAIAHQWLLPMYRRMPSRMLNSLMHGATLFLIALSLTHWILPLPGAVKTSILFGTFFVFLPLTFMFQDRYAFDSKIGNLSYPIYICHLLVFMLAERVVNAVAMGNAQLRSVLLVALVVTIAALLNSFIAEPVERVRRRIRTSSASRRMAQFPSR